MPRTRVLLVLLTIPVALQAQEPPVQVRDSAGITIVENYTPAWHPGGEWRVAPEPLLSLGAGSDDLRYEFTEVVGGLLRGDSTLVIADLSLAEVRYFGFDGGVRGVVGRRGDGPGEFRRIQTVGPGGGDTTWVFDLGLQRITLVSAPSDPVQVIGVTPKARSRLGGRLDDGSWLVVPWLPEFPADADPGLHRLYGYLVRHSPDGAIRDSIARVPVGDIVYVVEDGELQPWGQPLFARRYSLAVGGVGYYYGDQTSFEIGEYDLTGALQRLIRLPKADLGISESQMRAALDRRTRGAPRQERERFRDFLSDLPRPETAPAYQDFIVDRLGNLWVSRLDQGARGRFTWAPDWKVFDPEGRWLGTVMMPEHFEPMDIGEDLVLGVVTDDLDVQQVRVYALLK